MVVVQIEPDFRPMDRSGIANGKLPNRPLDVARLGQSGKDCYDAIAKMDVKKHGASFNLNMKCWETLMPHIVRHPALRVDLVKILKAYQAQYPGAMYSGCGGGYLIVASEKPVPGAFKVTVRIAKKQIRNEK